MSQQNEYLKGNYEITEKIEPVVETPEQATEEEFYRRAMEKLGGSSAFILKSKNLPWKGEETATNDGTAGS